MDGYPLAIGHRGAAGYMPENTKVSFMKALDLGAEAVEFDVQLTADEIAVVFHDDELDRTTDGTGEVAETTFDYIKHLDAGSWFGSVIKGVEVPTLEEVLDLLGGRTLINLELKADDRVDILVKHVLTAVARFDLFSSIVFSSFRFAAIERLCELAPDSRVGLLCSPGREEKAWARADQVAAENLHPHTSAVDAEFMERARQRGLKVWAWTANEPEEIERLCELGVDGIISDFPDRVVAARRAMHPGVG